MKKLLLCLCLVTLIISGCSKKEKKEPIVREYDINSQPILIENVFELVNNTLIMIDSKVDRDSYIPKIADNPDDVKVLVNNFNQLPENYEPADLVTIRGTIKGRDEAVRQWKQLETQSIADGVGMYIISGFRDEASQRALYDKLCFEQGKVACYYSVSYPGRSDHQTGLGFDITSTSGNSLAYADGTPEALWLDDNLHKYGFILRFPEGKEHITGAKYEPWHVRYVGVTLAEELKRNNQTLEEYYGEFFQ